MQVTAEFRFAGELMMMILERLAVATRTVAGGKGWKADVSRKRPQCGKGDLLGEVSERGLYWLTILAPT